MSEYKTNQLVLKSINQLFEYSFFIPSYQRGYRWSSIQVEQLLNDLWEFAKNPPYHEHGKERPFYCLQPVAVKNHGNKEWEVIDGQQRLTTLYLILKNLENQIERDQKNFTRIFYQTRPDSEEFLANVDKRTEEEASQNIDYFHIFNANKTIRIWFQTKANTTEDAAPKAVLAPVLLRDAKVVWFEIETENNHSIDIFTRLNVGKIPLTNAELIKALFLQKRNFNENEVTLKQIQIASEWDMIEKTLQDDAFWFFIYNPDNSLKYDNRIEYIFDLMKERKKDFEYYYTFNAFYKDFLEIGQNIDKLWLQIKEYFLTFEEWFKDYTLFHYIGYLIECGISINKIKKESEGNPKDQFRDVFLKKEIQKQVECDIDTIEYGDKRIKKILLLFNIQTVLLSQKSDMRFPFHKYKDENWNIEHVCSQSDQIIPATKRQLWIGDMIGFFKAYDIAENEFNVLDIYDEDEISGKEIYDSLLKLRKEYPTYPSFDKCFSDIRKYFKEDREVTQGNALSNLALLDASTNKSYGNSFFPIKRKRIIENDSKGIFVPIATKNLFLKYYSRKMVTTMYWENGDAEDYLTAIKEILKDFLTIGE